MTIVALSVLKTASLDAMCKLGTYNVSGRLPLGYSHTGIVACYRAICIRHIDTVTSVLVGD